MSVSSVLWGTGITLIVIVGVMNVIYLDWNVCG